MKISAMIEFFRKEKGIAVPVIAALVAAFLAMGHIERKERELMGFAEPVEVITASADIKAGEMISISAINLSSIPRKFLAPRAIFNTTEVAGRVAAVTIPDGAQISQTFLLPEGDIPLSSIIPAGMRLTTLPLPEAYGNMNISRGDRVDLIATFDLKENGAARGRRFLSSRAHWLSRPGTEMIIRFRRIQNKRSRGCSAGLMESVQKGE